MSSPESPRLEAPIALRSDRELRVLPVQKSSPAASAAGAAGEDAFATATLTLAGLAMGAASAGWFSGGPGWHGAASRHRSPRAGAEFSGCRGEEFREGVRVEASKIDGVAALSFFIQSAKADGKKKGLDVRCVRVLVPSEASEEVGRRWLRLAKLGRRSAALSPGSSPLPR